MSPTPRARFAVLVLAGLLVPALASCSGDPDTGDGPVVTAFTEAAGQSASDPGTSSDPSGDADTDADADAEDAGYRTYVNERFGFSASVPVWLDAVEQANGDGVTLTGRGATVQLLGTNEIQTERDFVYSRMTERVTITDETTDERSFSRSGYLAAYVGADENFYWQVFTGDASQNIIDISYPRALDAEFAPMVDRIVDSFRSGDLDSPH